MIKQLITFTFLVISMCSFAQNDSTSVNRVNPSDSVKTVQDQIYNRPFISYKQARTAVGGYIEGNTNYISEDGVTEGFSMELRRFNIFLYSAISKRITFLSEIEFEHGTEEIAIETAQLDFKLHHSLNFRAGIILPQIGIFNQNHDSPNWEIIDRPLSSTTIIPSTLMEVGFGLFGKFYIDQNNVVTYNVYALNGLQDGILINEEGKTFIPAGKNAEMFEEDNNGSPMFNGRLAISNRTMGEIGFSYYGGIYNSYVLEGEQVTDARSLALMAVDYQFNIEKLQIKGEYVYAKIDIPSDLKEIFGAVQQGFFADLIYPIVQRRILGYDNAKIILTVRSEYIDYNVGTFSNNGAAIGDEIMSIVGGISFRPTRGTVYRFNYRHQRTTDILGNPPALLGGIQFGFASYF